MIESVNDEGGARVVELTGIPCVGKSTYISFNNYHTIDELLDSSIIMNNAFYLFDLIKSGATPSLSIYDAFWLLRSSMKVRGSLFTKLNIFRNCILKFAYYSYLSNRQKSKEDIVIDEGISHIPFLLQDQINGHQVIEEFYSRFSDQLSCVSVVCLNADVDTIERLKSRGHKRLKSYSHDEVKKFNDMNKRTLEGIIRHSDRYKYFSMVAIE